MRKQLAAATAALETARTTPPTGTSDLSQGDEPFEVWLSYSVWTRLKGQQGGKLRSSVIEIAPTWDELFAALGPLMLDEAIESQLEQRLDTWAQNEYWSEVVQDINALIEADGSDPKNLTERSSYRASLSRDDFHTVIVQFVALGLIAKSDRKRSLRDTGTYWTLTPYGQTRLIQLRAIRRDGTSLAQPDEDGQPEQPEAGV